MKFILGKKIEMTQVFRDDGTVVPVTLIQAGPCVITQIRTETKDGYSAVQIGYGKKRSINKPLTGHLKDLDNFRYMREFKVSDPEYKRGDKIDVSIFEFGDKVDVTGISKGQGFQGVVKRHGFAGSPASHGHKDQLRMPGSIGATGPAHVFKGTKMGGRMGGTQVTVKNLVIEKIDPKNNVLAIKVAIPGARNSLVMIKTTV